MRDLIDSLIEKTFTVLSRILYTGADTLERFHWVEEWEEDDEQF